MTTLRTPLDLEMLTRALAHEPHLSLEIVLDPDLRFLPVEGYSGTAAHWAVERCADSAVMAVQAPRIADLRGEGGESVAHTAARECETAALLAVHNPFVGLLRDDQGRSVAEVAIRCWSGVARALVEDASVLAHYPGPEQEALLQLCRERLR